MTITIQLSLRQFVAANMPESSVDYREAAKELVALIPDADRDEYLIQAIMPIVADINGQRRRSAFDAVKEEQTSATSTGHVSGVSHEYSANTGGGQNFKRQDRFREHWAALLDTVGMSADGGRKRIGDMTAADLRANIQYRSKLAEENIARANQFRKLLAMVEEQGASTVKDLV